MDAIPIQSGFFYNGYYYITAVCLFVNDIVERKTRLIQLEQSGIVNLEVYNSIDQLYSSGAIIYTDTVGAVANAIGAFDGYCTVSIQRIIQRQDGAAAQNATPPEQLLNHGFVIDGIDIVSRSQDSVTYNIKLVGSEYVNLMRPASFNNNDGDPQSVTDIMKSILASSGGLKVDESFDKARSGVELNYMSSASDSVMTSLHYLLQKQFFFQDKLDSKMNILYYDMSDDTYRMFQPNANPPRGLFPVFMTFGENQTERLFNKKTVQLASPVTERKTDILPRISKINSIQYVDESNSFSVKTIGSAQILNYLGIDGDDNRIQGRNGMSDNVVARNISTWDNDVDVCADMIRIFKNYDSILVNVGGEPSFSLMTLLDVQVDTSSYITTADTTAYAKSIRDRYGQMCGPWLITSVHFIVSPIQTKFNQNLQLSRVNMNG